MRLRILTTTLLGQAHYHRSEYERVVALATDSIAALPADWVYEHFEISETSRRHRSLIASTWA